MASLASKIAGGVAVGGGGIGIATKVGLDMNKGDHDSEDVSGVPVKPETLNLLYKKNKFSETYSKETFGFAYGRFMVDDDNEEAWWRYSEREIKGKEKDTEFSSEFKKVVGENDEKVNLEKMNEVCNNAYKKKKDEVTNGLENDVWRYCSPLGTKPKTISEVNENEEYKNKWGGLEDIKKIMLAVVDENEGVWDYVQKFLLPGIEKMDRNVRPFNQAETKEDLKNGCIKAYKSEVSTSKTWATLDVFDFCSLDISDKPIGEEQEAKFKKYVDLEQN